MTFVLLSPGFVSASLEALCESVAGVAPNETVELEELTADVEALADGAAACLTGPAKAKPAQSWNDTAVANKNSKRFGSPQPQ
jgi:hypothetical protein